MKPLDFQVAWSKSGAASATDAEATFGSLRLFVDGENVTSFVEKESEAQFDHVEQPLLFLAEWLVENWWALLWEPEKNEDPDGRPGDRYFLSRHSLMAASGGFPLPDVRLVPTGETMHILAKPRSADHADVRFTAYKSATAKRGEVENELSAFVRSVLEHAPGNASALREAWGQIVHTEQDEADFCRLIGALGLSPYRINARIEAALDDACKVLSRDELFDLCQGSTAEEFVRSAKIASLVEGILQSEEAGSIDLKLLKGLDAPGDNLSLPPYKRGQAAARQLRTALAIGDRDIAGGVKVFDRLGLNPLGGSAIDLKNKPSPLSGAVAQSGAKGRVAIVHEAPSSRRFAAARATYFLWTGEPGERRLLTNAATRTQQASRAFAAELLVPKDIIRRRASGNRINWDQINAIAEEAGAAAEMVKHQATNSGLQVV